MPTEPPNWNEWRRLGGAKDIVISASGGAGTIRIIAGEYTGHRRPAGTTTPINLWDLHVGPAGTLNAPRTRGSSWARTGVRR